MDGDERDLAALERVALARARARFELVPGAAALPRTIQFETLAVLAKLEKACNACPELNAVPRLAEVAADRASDEVLVDRSALSILLQVDGRRTVHELAVGRGLALTVRGPAHLHALGLVVLTEPAPPVTLFEDAGELVQPSVRE